MSIRPRLALALGLSALAGWPVVSALHAADHGQMGETFPIIEADLLATIETRLRTLEANGGIERLQNQMLQRIRWQHHPHFTQRWRNVVTQAIDLRFLYQYDGCSG